MSKTRLHLLSLSVLAFAISGCANQQQNTATDASTFNLMADVETICKVVPQKYAYFGERSPHWKETCARAEKEASMLDGKPGALAILERIIDDLYDPHISLNTNNKKSPRLIPSGSDLWIAAIEDRYVVTAVRPMSGAAKADVRVGDELSNFNGLTPSELSLTRIHSGRTNPTSDRVTWAINAAVAGTRAAPRNLKIRRDEALLTFDLGAPDLSLPNEPVSFKTLSNNIGYIRFNNSLGNSDTVPAFNIALESLRETKGIILDLRETPGGGNTGVAEPILGRFIGRKTAYQRTVLKSGRAIDRKVKPTGPWTYDGNLAILVGRWTGSMGEGMAVGFDGLSRGRVMGSSMAGLAGGTDAFFLKQTGITFKMPTYDLHHLNGTPRHNWAPSELVTADNGAEEDILLKHAQLIIQSKS